MPRAPRVAIMGGGIGGLAAALAFERRGAETVVAEQSPKLSEIGAGLNLTPNAIKALRALGVEDRSWRWPGNQIPQHALAGTLAGIFHALAAAISRKIRRAQYGVHRADLLTCSPARSRRLISAPACAACRSRAARSPWRALPTAARSRPISSSAPMAFIRWCATACSAPISRALPAASVARHGGGRRGAARH